MTKIVSGMSKRTRIVAGVSLAMALAACSKHPGGQVVAVVNNQEITQQELLAEATAEGMPRGADFKQAAPAVLQRVIDRNLMAEYARDQGLDRSPEFLARRRQMEQAMLAALAVQKLAGPQRDPGPTEINAYIAAHPTLFAKRERLTLDQVRFATPKVPAHIRELEALKSIDLIELRLKQEGTPAYRSELTVDTAQIAPEVAAQITGLPAGELFDISAGGVTLINVVKGRSAVAGDPEQWNVAAREAVRRATVEKAVGSRVAELRKSAKIDIAGNYQPAKP